MLVSALCSRNMDNFTSLESYSGCICMGHGLMSRPLKQQLDLARSCGAQTLQDQVDIHENQRAACPCLLGAPV